MENIFSSRNSTVCALQFKEIQITLIKKENQIFVIYKEIQSGAVAKSYEEGLPNI